MNKITLSWPPKQLHPNARPHYQEKARIGKKYRAECYILTKQAKIEVLKTEKLHLFVDFYQPDRRHRDQHNIEMAMKCAYDGIADALGVNDYCFRIHPLHRDEIIKGGKVVVTITSDPA